MKALLLITAALLITLPAKGETVYLLIKSYGSANGIGLALHSLPMASIDQCEEMGATVISSERFDLYVAKHDAFECITGK